MAVLIVRLCTINGGGNTKFLANIQSNSFIAQYKQFTLFVLYRNYFMKRNSNNYLYMYFCDCRHFPSSERLSISQKKNQNRFWSKKKLRVLKDYQWIFILSCKSFICSLFSPSLPLLLYICKKKTIKEKQSCVVLQLFQLKLFIQRNNCVDTQKRHCTFT